MILSPERGSVPIAGTEMDLVSFGRGGRDLVIIPGLGDGLKTVRSAARTLTAMYRRFGAEHRVHLFSRRNVLPDGFTTREMAADLAQVLPRRGIDRAHILGVSQGGMIAQFLAIDRPQLVDRLVIGVSVARPNETVREVIGGWVELAERGDYPGLMRDSMERTYPERTARRYRPLYPLLTRIGAPDSLERFLVQARSCLGHDAYDELGAITAPTLVIGDRTDAVVGGHASEELAAQLPDHELHLTSGLGHAAFQDRGFNQQVLRFLTA